jgi:hypothetical protein
MPINPKCESAEDYNKRNEKKRRPGKCDLDIQIKILITGSSTMEGGKEIREIIYFA